MEENLVISTERLVEPERLEISDSDGDVTIVHIGSDTGYASGHVPGAVYLPPQALISGTAPAPGKLPSLAQLQNVFRYLGHAPASQYLVYDDEGGGWAGRFIWTLEVIGHGHWSYLDGGLLAWRAAGLPLETQPRQRPQTSPHLSINKAPIAAIDDILPRLQDNSFGVWDARSFAEFCGESAGAIRAGHIPGAVHCEWTELMDPQRGFRIRSDAEAYLRGKGITRARDWVTHCQSHHRSGFTYLVGRLLGLPVRAYDGSWSEWGNHPDTPIETCR